MKSQIQATQMNLNEETFEENQLLIQNLEEKLIKQQEKNKFIEAQFEENNSLVTSLKEKVMKEQVINKEVEDELIKLKIEYDNLKLEKDNGHGAIFVESIPMTEHTQLLNLKNVEINELKREQQIVAHVQMVQEGEIVEKEKELISLRNQITKLNQPHLEVNGMQMEMKVRPDKTKYNLISSLEEAHESDDDTETVTFHDALSDDEDVLIDDLDLDEDWVNVQHNRQDVYSNFGDLSLG